MSTIVANVGSSMSAATGRPGQSHLVYAVNQGAWWLLYLSGGGALSALYSTNFSSWTSPSSGSPFTLARNHNAEGRNFAFRYGNLSTTDVLHVISTYIGSGTNTSYTYHSRFTLSSTSLNNTNAETQVQTGATPYGGTVSGCAVLLDDEPIPVDASPFWNSGSLNGGLFVSRGTNTDSGSSWTAGFGLFHNLFNTTSLVTSNILASRGNSGDLLAASDNASATGSFTNLKFSTYGAGSGLWAVAGNVFSSALTSADTNAWGAVARTTGDIHFVALSDGTSSYKHRRWTSGSGMTNGDTLGTLAYGTNSGIFLATDGSSVWAFVLDTSNNLQFSQWTSTGGWSPWSVVTPVTSSSAYLSGYQTVQNGKVGLIWTAPGSSNYDIDGFLFNTTPGFPVGTIAVSQP